MGVEKGEARILYIAKPSSKNEYEIKTLHDILKLFAIYRLKNKSKKSRKQETAGNRQIARLISLLFRSLNYYIQGK